MWSNNMYRINVITNELFERYLDLLNRRDRFESRRRKLKYEGRFDNLDLDDITADITAPTDGEIDDAKRELDRYHSQHIGMGIIHHIIMVTITAMGLVGNIVN